MLPRQAEAWGREGQMGQETGLQSQEEEVGVQEGGLKLMQHMKAHPSG